MSLIQSSKVDKHDEKAQRKVKIKIAAISFGFCLAVAGSNALVNLQSSINISGGVGTTSIAVNCVTAIVGALIAPSLYSLFGFRNVLLTSNSIFVLYILANFYPPLLIPGGFLFGFAQNIWISVGVLQTYYAREFQKHSGLDMEQCIAQVSALLWPILFQLEVVGNGVAIGVLKVLTGIEQSAVNETSVTKITPDYESCGAKDCQDLNVTSSNMELYTPSRSTLTALLLTLSAVSCSGCILHFFLIPDIDVKKMKEPQIDHTSNSLQDDSDDETKKMCIEENTESRPKRNAASETWMSLRNTLLFIKDKKNLLMAPGNIYQGFWGGFFVADSTRSYVACGYGYSMVPLFMIYYSLVASTFTFVGSRFILKLLGRTALLLASTLFDAVFLAFALFWQPREDNFYMLYLYFLFCGLTQSLRLVFFTSSYSIYFPENSENAFTFWNVWWLSGAAIHLSINAMLCNYIKIYYLMAGMVVSSAFLGYLVTKYKEDG